MFDMSRELFVMFFSLYDFVLYICTMSNTPSYVQKQHWHSLISFHLYNHLH